MGSARTQHTDIRPGMDVLTLFGLFAVPAMLVFYMLEDRTLGSFLPSPARAPSAQLTASFKVRGRSAWWRLSGPVSPFGAGAQRYTAVRLLEPFSGGGRALVTTSGFGHLERQHFAPIACP
jgi:hypothetical protein